MRGRACGVARHVPGGSDGQHLPTGPWPSVYLSIRHVTFLNWEGCRGMGGGPGARASDGHLLPGNLLSSLMGSSEQEGEDSQDDSSPIELD